MKHERAKHPFSHECADWSCNICNLFICSICGGAEGSLTTDCPCYPVPYVMDQLVYAGAIDFVVDQWITKDPNVEITIKQPEKEDEDNG